VPREKLQFMITCTTRCDVNMRLLRTMLVIAEEAADDIGPIGTDALEESDDVIEECTLLFQGSRK